MKPGSATTVFILVVLFFYTLLPLLIYISNVEEYQFAVLSLLSILAVICIFIGSKIKIFDFLFSKNHKRIYVSVKVFISICWLVFLTYIAYVFYTAENIPILSAISGGSDQEVSAQRGAFLKGRTGLESLLVYVGTILSSAIIPYSIVLMFNENLRVKYFASFLFFLYCISFMAKSMFLSLVLPLIAFYAIKGKLKLKKFIVIVLAILLLLFVSIHLTSSSSSLYVGLFDQLFFTSNYLPKSALDYLVWRIISVPVYTASDSIVVFNEYFNWNYFLGGTSSFFSLILGGERVNFERFVFMFQFGSWNDTANANAFYVIDSFINFSIFGVIFYSIIVGLYLRFTKISSDVAFSSMWLLFIFNLFSANLIGTLLSNGFILILFLTLLFKIGRKNNGFIGA